MDECSRKRCYYCSSLLYRDPPIRILHKIIKYLTEIFYHWIYLLSIFAVFGCECVCIYQSTSYVALAAP